MEVSVESSRVLLEEPDSAILDCFQVQGGVIGLSNQCIFRVDQDSGKVTWRQKLSDCRGLGTSDTIAGAATISDCSVCLFDLHSGKEGRREDIDDGEPEQERLIAFSNLQDGDKLLGVYKESHSDAVECLQFQPGPRERLQSGGADGLVNIFNIRESCEDDALLQTLNVDDSIAKASWVSSTTVAAVTESGRALVWGNAESGDELGSFLPAKTGPFLVDALSLAHSKAALLRCGGSGGSVELGLLPSDGSRLKVWKPVLNFEGHDDLIRCANFNSQSGVLVSGGEDGRLVSSVLRVSFPLQGKSKKKGLKKKSNKPY